ncbi:MAG: SDR family oxidoreductase [Planctomycetota bacterium]|nr:SDR family oxidoreductase [Planctomycetota bacterium]
MDLNLDGKVALVTGGARGIGKAVVEGLLAEKAKVFFGDLDEKASQDLLDGSKNRENAAFLTGDLTREENCRQLVHQAVRQFGRVDIVVNNAGVNDSTGFPCSESAFLESLQKNLLHVFSVTRFATEQLGKNGGAIVNISSKVAVTGQGGTTGYAAAKGAVNALTREWAVEFASKNVTVNTVVPAECWTPLYENWINSQEDPAKIKKEIADLVPLGKRFTTSREIADTVVFLASPRSGHTTGQILFVDGGYTHLDRKLSANVGSHWSGNSSD